MLIQSNSYLGYSGEEKPITIFHEIEGNFLIGNTFRSEVLVSINDTILTPELPLVGENTNGFISFQTLHFYKSIYVKGKIFEKFPQILATGITSLGDTTSFDLNNSPYIQYRINFNQTGTYYVFHDGYPSAVPGNFFIGTNISNAVQVNRYNDVGFCPLSGDKTSAPILEIKTKGINILNIWRGNQTLAIKKIVLFRTDSAASLVLSNPETTISNYDTFKTSVNSKAAGISNINLIWKNPEGSESFSVSKSIKFVSIERGVISSSHPYGVLRNENFKLSLYTNISKIDYDGLVSYYCVVGTSSYLATQAGTNFTCDLSLGGLADYEDISLYANHTISGEFLPVAFNSTKIYIFGNFIQVFY